jgi:SAM-dependent methyltransferase
MATERDYVLGTHDEEISRLGLQHSVWGPTVLNCWEKAGITVGKRVLDVGAGPGYATIDLAGIVGPAGEVVALERSNKFVRAMEEACRARSLTNVKIHELDLMTDDLPKGDYDFSWCRWVATFVTDPALLVKKLGSVMPKGGVSIFHEYAHYLTWRFSPRLPIQEEFALKVAASWRAAGGEPDIALELPPLLEKNGFVVRSAEPRIFCLRPSDPMWQWPSTFIEIGLARLQELGRIDQEFAEKMRAEFDAAEADPNSLMITPLVLEIIAEKLQ